MSKFTLYQFDDNTKRFRELKSYPDLPRAIKRFVELRNNHNKAMIKGEGINQSNIDWLEQNQILVYEIKTPSGTHYRELYDLKTGLFVHKSAEFTLESKKIKEKIAPHDKDIPEIYICKEHGDFYITPNDFEGKNHKRIAYGCPDCNADVDLSEAEKKQPKYNEIKKGEWE